MYRPRLKLKNTYTVKVYISRGLKYSDSFTDSFKIKLTFNKEPNTEKGNKDRHDVTPRSYNDICENILNRYNTTLSKVDIHYSSYYTDNKSKLVYPRYIIITDESLHTEVLIKRRNESINSIIK